MTEFEKMLSQQLYDFSDAEIGRSLAHARTLCTRLQTVEPRSKACRALLEELIPSLPDTAVINPPFHCDHGSNIHLGDHVFFNTDCTVLDSASVTIGSRTLLGPRCQIYTPQHPLDYRARRRSEEYAYPVAIGANCWFGAGVIVCPGVTIGDNCVVAAGSVVVHSLPDNVLAAGNPASIKRVLN